MKQNPEFIGRRYSEEEKEKSQKSLEEWSSDKSNLLEGELEKTDEEIEMIETINHFLETELESLGITEYNQIKPDSIHILSGEVFSKEFPDFVENGFFTSTLDSIYINKEKTKTIARTFSCLLHELIHRSSTTKFYRDKENCISDARVGYRIRSSWKEEDDQSKFIGFNELMTDYTVYKVMYKNAQTLQDRFDITIEDIRGPIYIYTKYQPILDSIIEKVSDDKQISKGEVFDNFERGQFDSNILIMKDVENSFGKGSVRILSYLGGLDDDADNDELGNMIKNYFSEDGEERRKELGVEITEFVDKKISVSEEV